MAKKNSGIGKALFAVVILALLLLAAIKNPSKAQAQKEVKSMMLEVVDNKMSQELSNDSNSALEQIGSAFVMMLAPKAIDRFTQVEVNDYFFFSTFDVKVPLKEENNSLVSGIIVFGKILPLKSDLEKYQQ